jgi:hypothetical protein
VWYEEQGVRKELVGERDGTRIKKQESGSKKLESGN